MINALTKDAQRLLRPFKMKEKIFCVGEEKTADAVYNYIPASSERIEYKGSWTLHTVREPYVSDDPDTRIGADRYARSHQFPDGIMQTVSPCDASFSFETDADAIYMPHVSARAGLDAGVSVNGKPVGTLTCRSRWHGMNYLGDRVPLPKGKKRVEVEIEDGSDRKSVFRFGYIVEVYDGKTSGPEAKPY